MAIGVNGHLDGGMPKLALVDKSHLQEHQRGFSFPVSECEFWMLWPNGPPQAA
jgi:hypothetical protein